MYRIQVKRNYFETPNKWDLPGHNIKNPGRSWILRDIKCVSVQNVHTMVILHSSLIQTVTVGSGITPDQPP